MKHLGTTSGVNKETAVYNHPMVAIMTNLFADAQLSQNIPPQLTQTALGQAEYVELGKGPAIVTLHGAMGGYDQSLILAQTIGHPSYHYIALTRPGYLGTPLSSGASPAAQGDLIAALLDTLGIAQAGIIAVSGGGPAALQFGLRHPERCQGLVLVSTTANKVDTDIPFSFNVMKFLARWPWFVKRFQQRAEQDLAAVAGRSIQDPEILKRTINDTQVWPLFSTMLLSTYHRMGERIIGTENDIHISRTATYPLEDLQKPVLVVHGTQDRLVQFDQNAKLYQRRLPQVELLAVEGGEHVAIFSHRNIVREKVTAFMATYFTR